MQAHVVSERYQLPTMWQIVRHLRAAVTKRFAHLDPHLVDAVKLTVSELAENIVKFGAPDEDKPASIEVEATTNRIRIRAENAVQSEDDVRVVVQTLRNIRAHGNPTALFAEAIEAALTHPSSGSRQGFYQISAVAGFELNAELVAGRLIVVAERNL